VPPSWLFSRLQRGVPGDGPGRAFRAGLAVILAGSKLLSARLGYGAARTPRLRSRVAIEGGMTWLVTTR
jgi:hypothetical protein